MIPAEDRCAAGVIVLKTRPLESGHELAAIGLRKPRKASSSVVYCSCRESALVYGDRLDYQAALDQAARSHRSEITFGDYRLSRLLHDLELALADLDVDAVLELDVDPILHRYDRPAAREEPTRRRTPAL